MPASGVFLRPRPRRSAGALAIAAMVAVLALAPAPPRASGASFPDTSEQPPEIQSAIDHVTRQGYMCGSPDGRFFPDSPASRIDLAYALVRLFGHQGEDPDPGITFKDLKASDPDYRYANLAVKHALIAVNADGNFRPKDPVTAVNVMTGLVTGLGLTEEVRHLMGLYPRGPAYAGYMVVAHDLHLRYRNTRTWPSENYPRGEMAYSLQTAETPESWRLDYVEDSFDWLKCQSPWLGPARQKAMDAAFSKVGYPYVWGGETDAERGYDCSGLVYFVLEGTLGYPMQRVADAQARDDRYATVDFGQLLAGDPIFFYGEAGGDPSSYINHAGMYIGQGLFIHSTGSNSGVSVDYLSGYWLENFAWGKRVIREPEPETFDTYILLMNPGPDPASAELTYMMPGGVSCGRKVDLEPRSRFTVKVDDTLLNQEVSTAVKATAGKVIAERSMYFRYRGRYPGGHNSPGVTGPATTWYLPEGCTAYGFDTYILVQNPGTETARVNLTYMTKGNSALEQLIEVAPGSRYTVEVDSVPGMESCEFSTRVTSGTPVVVERSMYFDYNGMKDGHNSPGATGLSKDWYFAEGYTAGSFDTYILLMNPSEHSAAVTVTLTDPAGRTADVEFGMPPRSRRTFAVDRLNGWERREFSAHVRSSVPVAAERAIYFNYNGIKGGHDALGSTVPARSWYLAEGYTAQGFDTYVLLQNPTDSKVTVKARYMLRDGRNIDESYRLAPRSRYTVCVDKVKGLDAEEVSVHLEASMPVVVERSMYFRYGAVEGGTCSPGVNSPAVAWYFAEGYTGK